MSQRPEKNEHSEYFGKYIAKAKGDQILQSLKTGETEMMEFMQSLPADKWNHRYGPDKWTIKEAVIHLMDTERIFAYRALRVGRHDPTPLPGFDQDDYVPYYNVDHRTPESIITEYQTVRSGSFSLFGQLSDENLKAVGTASNHAISCRALGFMISGHEQHHLQIFREKYL